ncbi:hypothetical protein MCOR25_010091 [Pyricularia grisea]|nr:hypothetical protein MCOR25_010091 [Pyricularia grisea]
MHRRYLDCSVSDSPEPLEYESYGLHEGTAWTHYSRAIQLLLSQEPADDTETTAITLLVCYLLFCFDQLAGNNIQAMRHLHGGVKISHNILRSISQGNGTLEDTALDGARTLIAQVTRQIRRLDMQAAVFIVDWTPADLQDILVSSQLPLHSGVFTSLEEAADHLQVLVAGAMKAYWAEQQQLPAEDLTSELLPKEVLLGRLQTWWVLLHNTLQSNRQVMNMHQRLEPLLRLQYTVTSTLLRVSEPDREMAYDKFLPKFQECVALASHVHGLYYSKSAGPTFTPEVGLLPVLYIVGLKCRHSVVRRQALNILRRQTIREALWDSLSAATVVERVINIEEGGEPGNGGERPAMEDIAAWKRVENMSWLHFGRAGILNRVDITYRKCGQEVWQTESLAI